MQCAGGDSFASLWTARIRQNETGCERKIKNKKFIQNKNSIYNET